MGLKRPKPAPVTLALAQEKLNTSSPKSAKEGTHDKEINQAIEQTRVELTTSFKPSEKDFQILLCLGSGSSGVVEKVVHKPTGIIMARKANDESLREKTKKNILREMKILRVCRSPYIVEFYGAYAHDGDILLCMELMDVGSLDHISNVLGCIPEKIVSKLTIHILRGLAYLYDTHKIVHRDIKPSNILINSTGAVKIADFGVSKDVQKSNAKTFTGTGAYLAPERLREGNLYSLESDIWSLGLTLMEIAIGRFPFPPEGHSPIISIMDLLTYIEDEPAPRLPTGKFSLDFENFLALCLTKQVEDRPLPNTLLETPFCARAVVDGIDLKEWAQQVKQKLNA